MHLILCLVFYFMLARLPVLAYYLIALVMVDPDQSSLPWVGPKPSECSPPRRHHSCNIVSGTLQCPLWKGSPNIPHSWSLCYPRYQWHRTDKSRVISLLINSYSCRKWCDGPKIKNYAQATCCDHIHTFPYSRRLAYAFSLSNSSIASASKLVRFPSYLRLGSSRITASLTALNLLWKIACPSDA